MKLIKVKLISILILIISGYTMAQSNKMALSIYESHGYKASIPLLERANNISFENKEKIANSYRLNHDTQNAEIWYQDIVTETQNPIHFLHYAQVLQSNEKNDLASQYFRKYEEATGETNFSNQAVTINQEFKDNNTVHIKNATELNSDKLDYSPTYHGDQIIFVSNRYDKKLFRGITDMWTDDNFMAIWAANTSADGSLSTPKLFSKAITTKYNEGPICFSKDGNKMFFTRNNFIKGKRKNDSSGAMKLGIFTSVKKGGDWSKPIPIEFNTLDSEEAHPSITHSGDRLYFSSNREGGFGGMDLYYSDYENGKWLAPINLGEKINTSGNDVFPYIHIDGTLYYASNGRLGSGGLDLYQVSKDENNEWNNVKNMGAPFNSAKDDFALVMNESKREGYFTSARKGGVGKDDIYSFKSTEPVEEIEKETKEEPTVDVNDNRAIIKISKVKKSDTKAIVPITPFVKLNQSDEIAIKKSIVQKPFKEQSNHPINNSSTYSNSNNTSIMVYTETKPIPSPNTKVDTRNENIIANDSKLEEGTILELPHIYYDFNSSYLRNEVLSDLDNVVSLMKQYPSLIIELGSHTDSRGSESYNQNLSQKRANSAVKYLIKQGVESNRLIAKGFGESQIRNQCSNYRECTEEEHQYNRRTEIRVVQFNEQDVEIKYLRNLPKKVHKADPNRKWEWN